MVSYSLHTDFTSILVIDNIVKGISKVITSAVMTKLDKTSQIRLTVYSYSI